MARHVAQAQLFGRELALWRDDTGAINAWENRCPHRGVRLSIGINTGVELRCRYHAWRFASGSGQCTFIPAHPSQKPASSVHARSFAVVERCHLVWVNLEPVGAGVTPGAPSANAPDTLSGASAPAASDTTLRSIFVNAPVTGVANALLEGYSVDGSSKAAVEMIDEFTLTTGRGDTQRNEEEPATPAVARNASLRTITFLLQPVSSTQSIIHGLLSESPGTDWLSVLAFHNSQLSALRDRVEAKYAP